MRSEPILEIIDGLERLDVEEGARQAFRKLVLAIGTQHGIRTIEKRGQMDFVRKLLVQRVSVQTIRDRLMARYPISRRQAYRLIDEGLNCARKSN
jgi:hypothetical protein